MTLVRRRIEPWFGVLLLGALLVTGLDCLLLQKRYGVFTGGFLNPAHLAGIDVPAFLLGSLWLDAAAAVLFLGPALWITSRFRLTHAHRLLAATALCTLPICAAMAARNGADTYAGDLVQVAAPFAAALPARLVGGLTLLLAVLVCVGMAWRLARDVPDRAVAWLYRAARPRVIVVLLVGAPVLLACAGDVRAQLLRKTSGAWMAQIGEALTDVDGDGVGLVRRPADHAPFDGARYPGAVDRPGNGIDENGVGGDLEAAGDFRDEYYRPAEFVRRPDVVLIVLESFRADNLEATLDGRPVTPVLRRLRDEGALSGVAYSHNGYTVESHTHLFSGRLTGRGEDSLIDDFNRNGYVTACVSGQDETFGDLREATGLVRADYFVDARDDARERVSVSSAPGALSVPWTVVLRNVEGLVEARAGDDRPLFCYVNLQDCHYPYTHHAMKPHFTGRSLPRGRIVPENADRVRRAYLNAAANVDEAVGKILAAWTDRRGRRPAFVVLGDHGESLFDDGGVLGHGLEPCAAQTAIPFLVSGLPAECVFPLGQAEVRRIVRDALARPDARATARTDPLKWVWQYTGSPERPGFLGAAGLDGGVTYRLRDGRWSTWGRVAPAHRPPLAALIRLWEQIVLYRADAATAR